MNDQFGENAWEAYITALESAVPEIQAVGVTDYFGLDNYETVLAYKAAGRLAGVHLLFPNVEMRFAIATEADRAVNFHLLFSSEEPDHVARARMFLQRLTFTYGNNQYLCTREGIVALGRAFLEPDAPEAQAYKAGVNQFKVTPDVLKHALENDAWARDTMIVGVAGARGDGESGVRDAALTAVREQIQTMARVIFASSPKQHEYWAGEGAASVDDLESRVGGVKAVIHGSDAHELSKVGKPDEDRYTWIKGDPTFEALRQACLEPRRAVVATAPPDGALSHRVIEAVTVDNVDWLADATVPLNSGLVAIIGARGSGKTALADLIAAGANAANAEDNLQSFLHRAATYLVGKTAKLEWANGEETELPLDGPPPAETEVRAQYLSQQFVERLCSAEGITDELVGEIERVIFEAHPLDERMGSANFTDFLSQRAQRARASQMRARATIAEITEKSDQERLLKARLPQLKATEQQIASEIATSTTARAGLIVVGGEDRAARLTAVMAAIANAQHKLEVLRRRQQSLLAMKDKIDDYKSSKFPSVRTSFEREHPDAGLSPAEWAMFGVTFAGDPAGAVDTHLFQLAQSLQTMQGATPEPQMVGGQVGKFVSDDADLEAIPLAVLSAEGDRLRDLIGLDAQRAQQLNALNTKIATLSTALNATREQIANAEGADARIASLNEDRNAAYLAIFDGLIAEQAVLQAIYAPLGQSLGGESGALANLTFSVRRIVDAKAWADRGEALLDLRKSGPFRGQGELQRAVEAELLPAWQSGSSADVAAAMGAFRAAHTADIIAQSRVDAGSPGYRDWAAAVSLWLNSTDHIKVTYGIQYDGADIEQLSPGTRGIVLLLLYLAVDGADDRTLIIDQPEENLDPKSIFDELRVRFRTARDKRQIVIVTHNANLVVNTDADQVIVASVGPHRPNMLPELSYISGGLENPEIRFQVCSILEGGERAFKERAKRLRMRLDG